MSEPQKAGHPASGRPAPLKPSQAGSAQSDAADPDAADVLRVGTPQDILAFVPHCLGFQPRKSLVLLGLRGSRLGATLRLDLPGPSCSGDAPEPENLELLSDYSCRITSLLSGDEAADGVLAVIYTDLPWLEGDPPPYSALMQILADDLEDSGLRLRDAWLAGNGTWRDYFCGDGACCPWPGYPMGEVMESRLNAELVYRGSAYAASPAESLRSAGRLRTDELDERVGEVRRRMEGRWSSPEVFGDVLGAWEHRIRSTSIDGPASDGSQEDALLLASLEFKPVRDTILVLAAAGMAAAAEGAWQWLQPESAFPVASSEPAAPASAEAGQLFRAILMGRSRTAPDWDRMDRTYQAFTGLVQRTAGEPAAALLTLLGWIEWARGRSSRAEICLSGALREMPGYRLAALLRELLRRGELPQWAQSPETAWQGERQV